MVMEHNSICLRVFTVVYCEHESSIIIKTEQDHSDTAKQ